MKKQQAIITAALLGFGLAACHKSETAGGPPAPPAPPAPSETQMRAAYGFAAQMPANTDSYVGVYQLGKLWSDFKQSKTWASIRSNPLVSQQLSDPSFQQAKSQMNTNDEAAKWKAIVKEAFGSEAFVALAQGSGPKLHIWIELSSALRAANLQQAISGGKSNDPQVMLKAILPLAKDLEIPPMLFGFKITTQKAALDSEIEKGLQNLPPFVETGTFTVGNESFKSIAVTAGKALQPEQQAALQNVVSANISDPQQAADTYKALLTRRVEIAYGYVGDYFIISIGTDHSQVKFATNYGDSLLSRPEAKPAEGFADKSLLTFSWSSAEVQAACQQEFALMGYYDKMKDALAQSLQPEDVTKLETDLKRLDGEAKSVFTHDFTPMVGVGYRDHGLHGEAFGGIKNSSTAAVMKFSGVPQDSTFLWIDQMSNQAVNDALRVWFEDFTASAYDTFKRVGAPKLAPQQQMGFGMFQQIAEPKLIDLYKTSRDQFAKSLGLENVFAIDLNGAMPDVPMMPPQFHDGKMVRFAYLTDVRDRALLGESWKSYFKTAGDVLQLTPYVQMFPKGLPEPTSDVTDGVTLSYYPIPMLAGDLLPNVAVTDKTFVMSTSKSYSLELSKAALQAAPSSKPMALDVRINFKPAFDFADKWLTLAAQNPELFFKGDERESEEFKKNEPDYAALVQSLRVLQGMTMQAYEENGVPRISSQISWDEK